MIVQRPFYRLIGVTVLEAADGASVVRLEPTADTENIRGDVHGGALATMLDAALANAARSVMAEGSGAATVSLSINYLAPGQGMLMAHGRVVRAGRSLVSAEATITDAAGAAVAQAIGTLRVIAPKGASSQSAPKGASSQSAPKGASSQSAPKGASSQSAPKGASSESLPKGASSQSAPKGAPSGSAPKG